jgi:hypothetical protein
MIHHRFPQSYEIWVFDVKIRHSSFLLMVCTIMVQTSAVTSCNSTGLLGCSLFQALLSVEIRTRICADRYYYIAKQTPEGFF